MELRANHQFQYQMVGQIRLALGGIVVQENNSMPLGKMSVRSPASYHFGAVVAR